MLYQFLMTKLSTPPLKFFKHLNKHITLLALLIYCLVQQRVYQSRVHKVEELLVIWHGFQQSALDSAIDGECVFAPEYGPKGGHFELWQYGNRVSSHRSSEAMFQSRTMCFWNRLTIHKLIINVWHQELVEQMHFLNFYVSYGSATRFLRVGEKYYIYFVYLLLLFPTVKEFNFKNRWTLDKVIATIRQHVFCAKYCHNRWTSDKAIAK